MSAKNTNSHFRVRMLCEGAMMVALAQVLSYIKLMELPNGGSLTPAMFPIILFAVRWGLTPGLMAGFTFGLLQLIFDGAYAWGWQSIQKAIDHFDTEQMKKWCSRWPVQGQEVGHLCRYRGRLPRPLCRSLHQRRDHLQNSGSHGVHEVDLHQSFRLFSGL